MIDKLNTKHYWETYYKHNHASKKHIDAMCSPFDKFWDNFIDRSDENKTIIEIGGFPGRYLAYLSSKYKLKPTCLDYNSNATQIKDTFGVMGITDFKILQEDFTLFQTDKTYDYILSLGFIEHFEDFEDILYLHFTYMSAKSRLFVKIPNMRGYIRFYKFFVDHKNMKTRNLKCMKLKVLKSFAERHGLKIKYLDIMVDFLTQLPKTKYLSKSDL